MNFPSLSSNRKRARGFALLDLMVSILILGLLLVPLAMARNNVILMAERTVLLRKARALAAMKMGELALEKTDEIAPSGGDFSPDYPDFTWETSVEVVSLRELVGAPPSSTDEEETLAITGEEPLEDTFENYEVVKVVLEVRFRSPEGDEEEIDAREARRDLGMDLDDAPKHRALDRVVIARYLVREKATEETR